MSEDGPCPALMFVGGILFGWFALAAIWLAAHVSVVIQWHAL